MNYQAAANAIATNIAAGGRYAPMSTAVADGLADRMVRRADADGLPPDDPLRTLAAAFVTAVEGFYATPQTVPVKQFIGHWSRARRAWCDYTGEALI